jgi:hypothetical protein
LAERQKLRIVPVVWIIAKNIFRRNERRIAFAELSQNNSCPFEIAFQTERAGEPYIRRISWGFTACAFLKRLID